MRVLGLVGLVCVVSFSSSVWAFNLDQEIQKQERQVQNSLVAMDAQKSRTTASDAPSDDLNVRLIPAKQAKASKARARQ